jgi:hypothetical protein
MSGLFISYRRDATTADAGRLFDDLQRRCPKGRVFLDLDIPVGADFHDVIAAQRDSCIATVILLL